jgi:hypothetical protein
MIEGIDYCFIYPKDDKTLTNIKLLEGDYKDTVFKFGKVKIKEEIDGPHLHFSFDVLESKVKKPKKLQQDKNFTKYVGDLLVELMTDNIDEEIIDETRADDIKEPDL